MKAMTEKDLKIALEAANLVPRLSEVKKTYLLGFLEGYAAAVPDQSQQQNA